MTYLDVSNSLTNRRWIGPSGVTERIAEALMQETDLPLPICLVLARLGVLPNHVNDFLAPKIKTLLPNPRSILDMEKAARRLLGAIEKNERIAIFADYDVDGATSAALLAIWLAEFGQSATLYIPDRIAEGYGPNVSAMRGLAERHDLIICVDCGTLSHKSIAAAKTADVIILDHHLALEALPDCAAVVNPNRQDETGELSHLCAAAVVFLCLVECGRLLRKKGVNSPNLIEYLDLVALATVADVVPLVGVNRAFVSQGLKIMAKRNRIGLVALADQANIGSAPTPYHLGFLFGPRINAGGRVGNAHLGAKLLISQNLEEAEGLAAKLEALNAKRREIEEEVSENAFSQAQERGFDQPLVWAAGKNWHPGVVGIVASRLKEASGRPAIVISTDIEEGKGSGRSISGIDLGAAIQNLVAQGILLEGGGHKMAAGLTVKTQKIEIAMEKLSSLIKQKGSNEKERPSLYLDSILMPDAATIEFIEHLEKAGPYGAGAPAPHFVFANMQIKFAKRIGEKHLKFCFSDGLGKMLNGIAFDAFKSLLGHSIEQHSGSRFHLAGKLELNEWRGRRSVQLRLEDASLS